MSDGPDRVVVPLSISTKALAELTGGGRLAACYWLERDDNGNYRLQAQVPATAAGDEYLRRVFSIPETTISGAALSDEPGDPAWPDVRHGLEQERDL